MHGPMNIKCVLSLIEEHEVDVHSLGCGLMVTNSGWSAFPSINNCQGQLQTSRSVTVEGTAEFQKCLCRVNFLQEECHDIFFFKLEPFRGAGRTNSRLLQIYINPYPTAFPYGNGMVLHFYQQQESSTTKTVHKVINKGLKTYV